MDLGTLSGYRAVESYDGHDYDIELAQLPKSRAPSYVSTSKNSFWDGRENDNEALIGPGAASAAFDDKGSLQDSPRRVDTRLSIASTNRDKRKHWLAGQRYGWHFGVSFATGTATTVLFLNVVLTIWAATSFGTDDGIGTAYEGSCDVVNRWTTWLHIVINALSSLLLSASNYTMQALSAPMRQEVDRAHAKGDWVDIGVASVRNLFRIKWHRVVLWCVLALSSIPIHLLYNSAVFKTIDSNQYIAVVANAAWFDNGTYLTTFPWVGNSGGTYSNFTFNSYDLKGVQNLFAKDRNNETMFRRLTNTECINAYSVNFVSGYNNLVLVTNETGTLPNQTMFYASQSSGGVDDSLDYNWMCYSDFNSYLDTQDCNTRSIKKNADNWTINGKRIDHCIAQIQPQRCTLQFSIQVLIAVIICNALKSGSMFITLWKQKDATLVTIGDAISSFLDTPDERTKGRCLMSRTDIGVWKLPGTEKKPNTDPLPKTYFEQRSRWFRAASGGRWTVTFLLIIIAIVASSILLKMGSDNLTSSGVAPFSLVFGAIDSRATITLGLRSQGSSGLVSAVLLANCPQAIVSGLYLLYNSLLTSLLLAREWSTYALRRKPLRVTTPYGAQRSTYYLQLPFRYSAPLLLISGTLHWVISQSIFLARINVYDDGEPDSAFSDLSQVGYSCPPILTAILIGIALMTFAFGMGFQKFRGQMPVASSCSVAIAAACHRPRDDLDAAYLPIQWGELRGQRTDEIGHCCFTSEVVEELIPGRMYAGANEISSGFDLSDANNIQRRRVM